MIWQLVTPRTVANVHDDVGVNVPVELVVRTTVPPGGLLDPDVFTVIVHVVGWLTTSGEGAQLRVVVVCPMTVRDIRT